MEKRIVGVFIIAMVFILMAFAGCAKWNEWSGKNEADLRLGIHVATALAVKQRPQIAPPITAITEKVRAGIAKSALVNASQVEAFIMAQINLPGIDDMDRVIMGDLLNKYLEPAIKKVFADLEITDPAKQLVEIDKLCAWVLDITRTVK